MTGNFTAKGAKKGLQAPKPSTFFMDIFAFFTVKNKIRQFAQRG
jgi:hypothetical protein